MRLEGMKGRRGGKATCDDGDVGVFAVLYGYDAVSDEN